MLTCAVIAKMAESGKVVLVLPLARIMAIWCQLKSEAAGSRFIKLAGLGCVLKESPSQPPDGQDYLIGVNVFNRLLADVITAVITPRISFYILRKSVLNEH